VQAWPCTQRKEQLEFKEFTRSMFLRRRNQGLAPQLDVFHYLLGEDTETGTRLSESELAADSTLMVIYHPVGLDCIFLVHAEAPQLHEKIAERIDGCTRFISTHTFSP
ncbi:cytochrome P450 67, partial [Puccinia sorghi]